MKIYGVQREESDWGGTTAETVYDVYADFAMKNPFYELEQPIQAELFAERVMIAVKSCRNANSGHYSGGGGGGGYASSLY